MTFQTVVLYTAIVIFILLMIMIAVLMNGANKKRAFPPQTGQCPDYWQMTAKGCANSHNLGTGECENPKDFSKSTMVDKCKFAKGCGLTWDGITNAENDDGGDKYCSTPASS